MTPLDTLEQSLGSLKSIAPYQATEKDRAEYFNPAMAALCHHHYVCSDGYRKIVDGMWSTPFENKPETLPYIPVSIFKKRRLLSIDEASVQLTLTSSGTTGQVVSQILLDKETSIRQQQCLANSVTHLLGPKRIPMLVADTKAVLKDPKEMSARGAGVLGMMRYGYKPVFLLDEDGKPNTAEVHEFLNAYGSNPIFIFGFTFMVWETLHSTFQAGEIDLTNGILIHSGGWKKMIDKMVSPEVFRSELLKKFGLTNIYNFYGMVEQLGSIFLEGDNGLLFPPNFSDVIIRDPDTFEVCKDGSPGLIQLLSLIPTSYPGHSILTEDLGVIEKTVTEGHIRGKGLRVLGRVEKAELRGCSEVIATEASA